VLGSRNFATVAMVLIAIIVLVVITDYLGTWIRSRII